jgi:hypothetical protein
MKSSEKLDAPSAEHRKLGENRFEHWLRQRRENGLLLLLGVVFLLFGLDSILAYAVVLSGMRQADAFYATAWMSTRAADHANLPGLREVLLRHPKRYVFYSDRFEADGLHGGRLVRNFLTTTADLTTDWSTKSFWFSTQADWITKSFWFSTNDQGFPPVAEGMLHYDVPKPVGTFRVMVLGGSTVEGWGVARRSRVSRRSCKLC